MKFQTILLVSILLTNCTVEDDDNEELFNNFDKYISIKTDSIQLSTKLLWAEYIIISDSLLIFYEVRNLGEYLFNIYDKRNFSFIKGYAKKGRGPGEYSVPGFIAFDKAKKNIWMPRDNSNDILQIDSIINKTSYLPRKKTFQSDQYKYTSVTRNITEKYVITSGANEPFNVLFFDKRTGDLIKKIGKPFIEYNEKYPDFGYSVVTRNGVFVNENDKRIASFNTFKDLLIIYDFDGNELIRRVGPDNLKVEMEFEDGLFKNNYGRRAYWLGGDVTNKYIFLTYSGKIKNSGERERSSNTIVWNYPNTIHIFDWDGNPLVELTLDRKVFQFAIDEESNELIGFDPYADPFHSLFKVSLEFL